MTETAPLWPDVRVAYRWVYRAAHILTNEDQQPGATVQRRLSGLLGAMMWYHAATGLLAPALVNFLKVTRSYWPGLFHCYEVPDLPRTNNDLEPTFKGVWHVTGNFAPLPLLDTRTDQCDTRTDQCPPPHR